MNNGRIIINLVVQDFVHQQKLGPGAMYLLVSGSFSELLEGDTFSGSKKTQFFGWHKSLGSLENMETKNPSTPTTEERPREKMAIQADYSCTFQN